MARRPRMSPEAKAAKKEQKEAANAQNLAADALLCFPRDLEKQREEFVDVLDQLTSAAKSAAGDVGAHRKRLIELYQIEPWVLTALKSIRKLGPGRKERAIRQFTYLVKQFGLDAQLDLFNETAAPGGATRLQHGALRMLHGGWRVGLVGNPGQIERFAPLRGGFIVH